MPRTVWSGAISFGLVTVPIHVVSATENHAIRFHQYHLEDMSRVRKICEIEDREVPQDEIGKAYEISKNTLIAPQALIGHMTRDGQAPPETPASEAPAGKVVDLMAALEASVKKARNSRGEGDADVHELHPKKKTPAKKPAKKTATKKTTAKKAAKKTATKPKRSA
ncbi:hypothetical protein C6Y14_43475 [Streptomyces dioscori]|uniref:Ku domain-containing protein n=1 Tax=Streptomyces dioscori TaxID=2109333 RepID=A0A2P8PTC8_9ACTN|nr:Ku protein [Streptomyces dioscori]PSM37231.1 hypothetical protein C6Y14_43475 [Streptomyces dioscori]